jgi:oxygen-independent coproporphyrinogen-3 oxidase
MLNALRLNEGFDLHGFEARTGLARSTIEEHLNQAFGRAWLYRTQERIRCTEQGARFLNDVVAAFLPD